MRIEENAPYCPAPTRCGAERPLLVHHVAKLIHRERRTVRRLAQTDQLHGFKLGGGGQFGAFGAPTSNGFLGGMMNSSSKKPRASRIPALEVELTKSPDGKLRSFRVSIGTAAVMVLLMCLRGGASDSWLPALKWIVAIVR